MTDQAEDKSAVGAPAEPSSNKQKAALLEEALKNEAACNRDFEIGEIRAAADGWKSLLDEDGQYYEVLKEGDLLSDIAASLANAFELLDESGAAGELGENTDWSIQRSQSSESGPTDEQTG